MNKEFFWQLKGSMEVVTVQNGRQKPVPITAGHAFLLPSRIRHSPRRQKDSIGLVIEREREEGELDSMCWFVDEVSNTILWEKYFICKDLGKDLVPVFEEFHASNEFKTGKPTKISEGIHIPLAQEVPEPIDIERKVQDVLHSKRDSSLFGSSHPDREYDVILETDGVKEWSNREEIFFMQIKGEATIDNGGLIVLREGEICLLGLDNVRPVITVTRPTGTVGLVVSIRDLKGNKPQGQYSKEQAKL